MQNNVQTTSTTSLPGIWPALGFALLLHVIFFGLPLTIAPAGRTDLPKPVEVRFTAARTCENMALSLAD